MVTVKGSVTQLSSSLVLSSATENIISNYWYNFLDKIYVIGGNSGINKRIDVMETEVYSPDFDQWTMVAQLSMGQSEAGACLVNDRIFIVGGYCWSARRCIKVIQV